MVAALQPKMTIRSKRETVSRVAVLTVLCLARTSPSAAVEHVVFRQDGKELQVDGRLVVEAQDGGLLVLARDGVLWAVPPDQQVKHTRDEAPFRPFPPEEMARRILPQLPAGFDVHRTSHYLIVYNTSRPYAQWCGSLFERLYMAFTNYWSRKGFELSEPEFPLLAVVFADKAAYARFSRQEAAVASESIIGYFNLQTNRMTMYDLTGIESSGRPAKRVGTAAEINQVLARPEALQTVATIVHEATHQIAFNCGLHTRYSACPMWFSEGIAIYFETPDLSSTKGWRAVGMINQPRLLRFHDYLRGRPPDSLKTLITTDARFRDPKQGIDAYAEAWVLTYYLIRQRPKEYVAYLKMLSEKKPLVEDGPQQRLAQFEQVFGDWKQLDGELLRYVGRLR
jgi:hypothetical protein